MVSLEMFEMYKQTDEFMVKLYLLFSHTNTQVYLISAILMQYFNSNQEQIYTFYFFPLASSNMQGWLEDFIDCFLLLASAGAEDSEIIYQNRSDYPLKHLVVLAFFYYFNGWDLIFNLI